jgi:hypothetical protein
MTLREILLHFPILRNLMFEVKQHCQCMRCNELELVPGCLLHIALVDCLALLAHGVADGFGVTDVSGTKDSLPLAKCMLLTPSGLSRRRRYPLGCLIWCCSQRVPRLLASVFTHPSKSQRLWQHNHPMQAYSSEALR